MSKIFILSHSEVLPTLTSFIDIENIPKQYGGKLDFDWCDEPNLDPHIKAVASWEKGHDNFPQGPLYWVPQEDGKRLACVARGSVEKKERNEIICTIPKAFADEEANGEAVVANGKAVGPAEGKLEEAPADIPAAAGTANGEATAPAVTNGVKEVEVPQITSPATENFVDAPEAPLASPNKAEIPDIQGVQNLSLNDAEEKNAEVAAAVVAAEKATEVGAVPNGKPVVA